MFFFQVFALYSKDTTKKVIIKYSCTIQLMQISKKVTNQFLVDKLLSNTERIGYEHRILSAELKRHSAKICNRGLYIKGNGA